ncbi:MAG: hypothetical protein K2L78_08510 [Muribaculaceae bacterium]|nr:hypothetical protein [Muribaculaceae bacterium]
MNEHQLLKKAIAARGAGHHLPPTFSADVMLRIAAMQKRRHHRMVALSVAGYIAAAVMAAGTVAYFYNDIFSGLAGETMNMFNDANSHTLRMVGILCPPVALLIAADAMMRRRFKKASDPS